MCYPGKKWSCWTILKLARLGKYALLAVAVSLAFLVGNIFMYFFIKRNEMPGGPQGLIDYLHSSFPLPSSASSLPRVERLPRALVSSSTIESTTNRTRAVCLAGHRGQYLLKPVMIKSLIDNILKPNDADLFAFVTVDNISTFPIEEFQRHYGPWLKRFVIIEDSVLKSEIEGYNFMKEGGPDLNRLVTIKLFLKLHKCYNTLIAPYELERGMVEYQQVFYTRPDLQFFDSWYMNKYTDDAVLYSPRPNGWEKIKPSPPDSENNGVFFFPWNNDMPGVNDQTFLASGRIFRLLSNAIWLLLPEVPDSQTVRKTFQEHIVWWILRDRYKITVKWVLDLPNAICRDSMPCSL